MANLFTLGSSQQSKNVDAGVLKLSINLACWCQQINCVGPYTNESGHESKRHNPAAHGVRTFVIPSRKAYFQNRGENFCHVTSPKTWPPSCRRATLIGGRWAA
eukprot:GHVU01003730.1.p4 GENE.GHVU01003730.1~~GHVU01003730.1.p4  ORF type:complete len:103 (+),score=1.89 GHVU01003730.1:1985-2293(+)